MIVYVESEDEPSVREMNTKCPDILRLFIDQMLNEIFEL